jgi:hypothetical protein
MVAHRGQMGAASNECHINACCSQPAAKISADAAASDNPNPHGAHSIYFSKRSATKTRRSRRQFDNSKSFVFFVGDRQNDRIQSFDAEGKFIDQWFQFGRPSGIRIGSARDGKVTAFIPDPCPYPYAGVSTLAEGVTVDAQGNVYGADFLMNVGNL